ncbi:MAG: ankyrin repeat domain-containing protein [Methylocella sp.]
MLKNIRFCFVVILGLTAATPKEAAAAGPSRPCQELEQNFVTAKIGVDSLQLNILLFSAADRTCQALAERLLAAGASLEARDRAGARPLSHAAKAGKVAMVEIFLAKGAPIDARDLGGATALSIAAENDRVQVVQFLLEKGADPNLGGRSEAGPLIAAAYNGNRLVLHMLLDRKADPGKLDSTGKSAILYAAARGNAPIVRDLLDAGVDVNATYSNGLTALMWAAGHAQDAGIDDVAQTMALLLERGALVEAQDARGRNALMIAAELNHQEVVKTLLAHGADASQRDKMGKQARDLTTDATIRALLAGARNAQNPER